MLRTSDMSNTIPDEKTVITYLAYLCARLLSIRNEQHAATVIQMAWRRYRACHHPAVSTLVLFLYLYCYILSIACISANHTAHSMISCWHDNVVFLSVHLSVTVH